MCILIVDDTLENRIPLQEVLKGAGYTELTTASSAGEAFQILGLEGEGKDSKIDLILMDIMMPDVDGIEACGRIKSSEKLREIPILMVTAQTELGDLEAAFNAGAMDYITKPVHIVELLARVRSALSLKREMDARKNRERELVNVTRQLAEAYAEMRLLSLLDGLTGIANRRHFDATFTRNWHRAARNGSPLSVVMIDIDFFKDYNDTCGHQSGDECLRQVADFLNSSLHRPDDMVARYGGEEFVLLLPDTSREGALMIAERLRAAVEKMEIVHEHLPICGRVTLSLGVACAVPQRRSSPEALLGAADRALYQAKHEGRNRVRFEELPAVSPVPFLGRPLATMGS